MNFEEYPVEREISCPMCGMNTWYYYIDVDGNGHYECAYCKYNEIIKDKQEAKIK